MAQVLTSQREDFPRWYQDVVAKAELAEHGPVKGQQVIRPAGYALWERMVSEVDDRIKATGAENASFPLLIPQSRLSREAQHVEGFAPETWNVTHAGGKELDEPVAVRPTSETIVGDSMSRWVQSYRDLPLLLNQWCNVMRYEMRTRLFLRTSEFLWQEGHTAHASRDDARAFARRILHEVYRDFMVDVLALPVLTGVKTAAERFAGAINTYTCEAMMRDGKALQAGTSHELGQNFATAFDIQYLDSDGRRRHAWTTSWGVSTRMVGGLIMGHGDDDGLRVPPRLAPVQAYVMAVKDGEGVCETARRLHAALRRAGVRAKLDLRVDVPFGRRAVDAELKGYPTRIEVGPRDLAEGKATLVRRVDGAKTAVSSEAVVGAVLEALDASQKQLYAEALSRRDSHTVDVSNVDEAIEAASNGFVRMPWADCRTEGEARAAAQGVSVRCLQRADGSTPVADDEPDLTAVLSRSY